MTTLTRQFDFRNVDFMIGAGGDARDGSTSVIIAGAAGEQKMAFLYWGELNFGGSSDGTIDFNGTAVTGQRLGTSVDTCWGSDQSVGYFANVTNLVSGDGTYSISGMGEGGQGATLVVFHDDGDFTNNRDVTLYAGNDAVNRGGNVTNIRLGDVAYEKGTVNVTMSVGDGQDFSDGELTINGTSFGTNQFQGADGALWDVNTYDITGLLSEGDNNVSIMHVADDDCLQFVTVLVDKEARAPVLFLDFATAIPRDFYVATINLPDGTSYEDSAVQDGSEPLGVFTAAQEDFLVTTVQKIFDDSGIAMNVTKARPAEGDFLSVRFTSTKLRYDDDGNGSDNSRLLGQAYEGIDRYDTQKNNIVAVLMDGSDDLQFVAETVAHEGGHALGARHINPLPGDGQEVMDYDDEGDEQFYDQIANITEPPVDGEAATAETHNPTYHIRRYVNGESDEQLRLEGVTPGTWDRGAFNNFLFELGLVNLQAEIRDMAIIVQDQAPLVQGASAGRLIETIIQLSEIANSGSFINFNLNEGQAFRLVGSSGGDGTFDIFFEFNPDAPDPFSSVASGSGIIGNFIRVTETGALEIFGQGQINLEEVLTIDEPDGLPDLVLSVDSTEISEDGGVAVITITRIGDTAGDLTVRLSSDNTLKTDIAPEVTIADGETSVQVDLTTFNDFLSDGSQNATITAEANGYTDGTIIVTILDDETAIIGTPDPDVLDGTSGADQIFGLGDDDTLNGFDEDDELFGGAGIDTLIGGLGNDTLDGGLHVGAAPAGWANELYGGDGDDTYHVRNPLDLVDEGYVEAFRVFGFGGTDTVISHARWYWDVYGIGEKLIIAEDAADPSGAGTTIVGGVFDNEIIGNSKTNIMFGRGGSDTYRAGDGIDFISLSLLGVDGLYDGVDGVNTIVVEARESGTMSYDIVFEFESGKDKLDVSDYGFASQAEVFARGVDAGDNSYFALGDGFDYLYMIGLNLSELSAGDFIV